MFRLVNYYQIDADGWEEGNYKECIWKQQINKNNT